MFALLLQKSYSAVRSTGGSELLAFHSAGEMCAGDELPIKLLHHPGAAHGIEDCFINPRCLSILASSTLMVAVALILIAWYEQHLAVVLEEVTAIVSMRIDIGL